ncbi:hypothetical protein [Rhodoblastus sp.]|uniref:hypothetical protein n=1 Tax=Rhodoblastus sp. TaxID=1962975 RepID=UPI003F98C09C
MIDYREFSWWYWVVTDILLFLGLAGHGVAFALAIALSLAQIVHFRWLTGAFAAFPTQVRIAYAGLLLLAFLPVLRWLYWIPAIGTLAQVLFGYCTLARCLSLMPWNRRERLTWLLVWRTFASRPVKGSVMQGLPEAT